MNITKIQMPDRLITIEGGYAEDVAAIIRDATAPRTAPIPAHNAEEPLAVPAMNFDPVAHAGGGYAPDAAARAAQAPANYGGRGPVPTDSEFRGL